MRALSAAATCGCVSAVISLSSALAAAQSSASRTGRAPAAAEVAPAERQRYVHGIATLGWGRGVRFSNPYRLKTQLGDSPESLSLTANYIDLGAGVTLGDPQGLQHGAVAHLSIAVEGISQEVMSLSYLALRPIFRDVSLFARAGAPIVLEPDFGVGLELGLGAAWLLTGGIGVSAEFVPSLFFGASTWESSPSIVPIVALQAGLWLEYEVLP